MHIGPYRLVNRLILAPMAGVTDRPFRTLCRRYGAALAVSEMVSANPALRNDRKTLRRSDHAGEPEPRAVQILGNDPKAMAEAARINVDRGAQIIDINMGCPAKKVCNKAAGSALLKDELLVGRILETVVGATTVPVTLKIRTGWDPEQRNAAIIAKIAESSGIRAITVHGRTRACGFSGHAEYLTIQEVKQTVSIPVIANGDIDTPEKAAAVLEITGADAVMIGRATLGNPWLFRRIDNFLRGNGESGSPEAKEIRDVIVEHLGELYAFYGEHLGVRIARKHVGWYLSHLSYPPDFGTLFNAQDCAGRQLDLINLLFNEESRKLAA
ncbi:tRNA dihydrouridine synthase DusB [Methylocaldum sp.]|uniref:tRNA dihydrouridine synthase DusB n=1 Tax=Methylocaldum sp. TaxID=1969727 RepID=UPI002D47723D|nr:tRNA dihydrouridine synthase DusB [Methylocaldum sp.]HYE35074.1 tRNA dihydrouridine synthase DusB [Methylocaldum sp.]